MTWTHFNDMHSGGGQKLEWDPIIIEAPESEACAAFERLFGREPGNTTCDCCGPDYSITESETLEEATAYERGCVWRDGAYVEDGESGCSKPYQTLDEYRALPHVKIVTAAELATVRS
jgi:hypothetical protein